MGETTGEKTISTLFMRYPFMTTHFIISDRQRWIGDAAGISPYRSKRDLLEYVGRNLDVFCESAILDKKRAKTNKKKIMLKFAVLMLWSSP